MHEHRLILIREFTGHHNLRWCMYCGLIYESFSGSTFTEMIPQWSEDRLLKEDRGKEKYSYASEKEIKSNRSKNRLGRGLKDLSSQQSNTMRQLLLPDSSKNKNNA